jgi:pilus assembly protein CpaC
VSWLAANRSGTSIFTSGNGFGIQQGTSSTIPPSGIPVLSTGLAAGAPFGVVLANLVNGGTSVDVLVNALESKGLVRKLAEPNLIALSGDTASFLAGGEFPVPIATSVGGVGVPTIEYKPFGVRLSFTPTVLQSGIINLRSAAEVSDIDRTLTNSTTGAPGLSKRDAVTTIELRDGQTRIQVASA